MEDKLRKLYIDLPNWRPELKPDDFLVAVGKLKSNSVYHIAESRPVPSKVRRITRYHLKVYKSDLLTAIKRGSDQQLTTVQWRKRKKL